MTRLASVLGAALVLAGCGLLRPSVHAEVDRAAAEDGSIAYLWAEPPGAGRYPIVLYLHGSGCGSVTSVIGFSQPL